MSSRGGPLSRAPLGLILAAGLGLLFFAATLTYANLRRLSVANWWVTHTHEVRAELAEVISAVGAAETAERGFVITGDRGYLAPYVAARRALPARLDHLDALTADNAEQQRFFAELRRSVSEKLAELRSTITARKRSGFEAARRIIATGRGKRQMARIRAVMRNMVRNEDVLLAERASAANRASVVARLSFGITALLALTALLVVYDLARQRLRHAHEREDLLRIAQRARSEAEMAAAAEHEAREMAEAASEAKDAFLATISHELRTPLSPILAWVRMLRQGKVDSEKAARALEVIERSARAEAQLVEDLLDVSRIVSGKMRLEVRPVMLAPVIEKAVEIVRPAAEAKIVRLQLVLDTEAGAVLGDAERLQQVVWNLLANAVKFTPKGGRVQVALERVNSHVEIAVSDSGQGIAAEFLPHVFERFRQADMGSSRGHGGLGLGLAIVRNIVEGHGGTVHAESAGVGEGAVFTVKLPLMVRRSAGEVERRHPTAATGTDGHRLPPLDGLRLLIVDDEPDSNDVVQEILASCGAEVRVALSAEQAREILGRWEPDMVVSDVGMPGEDGYAFIASLRAKDGAIGATPAVALTAYASREDKIRLLSAGYQAHVPKPVDPSELVAVIANLGHVAGKL